MIVVVLRIMLVFPVGCVQVLVGRVALIVNIVMTKTEYLERLINRKAYSDLIKNENNLLMIREPLTMLIPCCTKPLTKVHLSTLGLVISRKIHSNSFLLKYPLKAV